MNVDHIVLLDRMKSKSGGVDQGEREWFGDPKQLGPILIGLKAVPLAGSPNALRRTDTNFQDQDRQLRTR